MSLPQHRCLSALALAGAAGALAACSATASVPQPPPSLPPRAATTIGHEVTTTAGNRIAVERYVARVPGHPVSAGRAVSAIKVRVCASAAASSSVTLLRSAFQLLLHPGPLAPVATETLQPALSDQQLDPGACSEGWISYRRPVAQPAIGVVLAGSTAVLWEIHPGRATPTVPPATATPSAATSGAPAATSSAS